MKIARKIPVALLLMTFVVVALFSNVVLINKVSAGTATNLIANSSFEEGLQGWTDDSAGYATIVDEGLGGQKAIKFSKDAPKWASIYSTISVKANTDYVLSFLMKGRRPGKVFNGLMKWDNPGRYSYIPTHGWVRQTFYFNSEENTSLQIYVLLDGEPNGEEVWFDNFEVYELGYEPDPPELVQSLGTVFEINGDFEDVTDGMATGWNSKVSGEGLGYNNSNGLVISADNSGPQRPIPDIGSYADKYIYFEFKAKAVNLPPGEYFTLNLLDNLMRFHGARVHDDKWTLISGVLMKSSASSAVFSCGSTNKVIIDDFKVAVLTGEPVLELPTPEPTPVPTEEPTPEPTPEPGPVAVSSIEVSSAIDGEYGAEAAINLGQNAYFKVSTELDVDALDLYFVELGYGETYLRDDSRVSIDGTEWTITRPILYAAGENSVKARTYFAGFRGEYSDVVVAKASEFQPITGVAVGTDASPSSVSASVLRGDDLYFKVTTSVPVDKLTMIFEELNYGEDYEADDAAVISKTDSEWIIKRPIVYYEGSLTVGYKAYYQGRKSDLSSTVSVTTSN